MSFHPLVIMTISNFARNLFHHKLTVNTGRARRPVAWGVLINTSGSGGHSDTTSRGAFWEFWPLWNLAIIWARENTSFLWMTKFKKNVRFCWVVKKRKIILLLFGVSWYLGNNAMFLCEAFIYLAPYLEISLTWGLTFFGLTGENQIGCSGTRRKRPILYYISKLRAVNSNVKFDSIIFLILGWRIFNRAV